MVVNLLSYTPDPEAVCARAAAISTDYDDEMRALKGALSCGHDSVLEHAVFTFEIKGVSRALLAQITRHRLASFVVQSQRYVDMTDKFDYVVPDSIREIDDNHLFETQMRVIQGFYEYWIERLKENGKRRALEDARYILPNAMHTRLVMTMNARELRHFFKMRCCNRAQWEIRALADAMLTECKKVAPLLFKDAGPGCVRGRCPEGKMSCGSPRDVKTWDKTEEKDE